MVRLLMTAVQSPSSDDKTTVLVLTLIMMTMVWVLEFEGLELAAFELRDQKYTRGVCNLLGGFMGSYKGAYKSPNMGYKYSYHTYNTTCNYP